MTRRLVLRGLLAVVGLLVVVVAWAGINSVKARSDLARARARLTALPRGDVDSIDAARASLRAARDQTTRAVALMRQPGPAIAARLPLVGRSFAAVRSTAAAADAVVAGGVGVVDAFGEGRLFSGARVDLEQLARVRSALEHAAALTGPPVARLASLRTGWTPRTVRRGVADARHELGGSADLFANSAGLLKALNNMLGGGGDRTMLIGLQNNAELRATGGLVSYVSLVTARDGVIAFGGFQEVDQLSQPPGKAQTVAAPKDYSDRYGRFLANSTLWKNVNMSPDGPSSMSVLASVAEKSLGTRPDGVLLIDVPAVVRILKATGPADLPDGGQLTTNNAAQQLLVGEYKGADDTPGGQAARRRRLRLAADAVVRRLLQGDTPALKLLVALQRSAAGRHLQLWSADARDADALARAKIDGGLPRGVDLALISAHNLGSEDRGNKLDFYMKRDLDISVVVGPHSVETTERLVVRNSAPTFGLSVYVAGAASPGTVSHIVTIAIPTGADLKQFDRDGVPANGLRQTEAGHDVIDSISILQPGARSEWLVRYTTPLEGGRYRLVAVPQPLPHPATLHVNIRAVSGVRIVADQGENMRWSGDWDASKSWQVRLTEPGLLARTRARLKRWWTEPVHIGQRPFGPSIGPA